MDMSSEDDDAPPRKTKREPDAEEEISQGLDPREEFPLEGKYRNSADRKA